MLQRTPYLCQSYVKGSRSKREGTSGEGLGNSGGVEVGERLVQHAPRPLLVRGDGGESSALSTLLLARMLPQLANDGPSLESAREVMREARRDFGEEGGEA